MKSWPVNIKGPTFLKIKGQFEAADEAQKMQLLISNSSAVKRPILEDDGRVQAIGFDPEFYR